MQVSCSAKVHELEASVEAETKPPSEDHSAPPAPAAPPAVHVLPPVDAKACPGLCEGRCRLHSRPNHCKRVCNTCCYRCKCVPPGTYGNREMCGKCYTDMTTHGGRPKCP
ncbi:Gibberellin-regulated protein 14 [Nymphaea thermarum]|nr:Gibberellin-regulated protein 14 [Nymphaea thermarum]